MFSSRPRRFRPSRAVSGGTIRPFGIHSTLLRTGPRPPFHARATLTSPPFTSIDLQTLTALNPAHLKVRPASYPRNIASPAASQAAAAERRLLSPIALPAAENFHRLPPRALTASPSLPHQALLGQEVVVTLGDTSTRTGIVYNVDPVNFSVALLKVRTDRPTHKSKLPFHGTRHYHGNRGCRAKSSDCLPV